MHIGFVSPRYPPGLSVNGISTYTALMVEELARQGHSITVFSQTPAGDSSCQVPPGNAGIDVCTVGQRCFSIPVLRTAFYGIGGRLFPGHFQDRDPGRALRAAAQRVHREHPIDVLECPEVRGLARWLHSLGMPIVVRLHAPRSVIAAIAGVPRTRTVRGIASAERRCLRQARFRSAPSRAVIVETEKVLDLRLNGVRLIPNPCCLLPSGQPGLEAPDAPDILFVGRTELLKGFDILIAAFTQLASRVEFRDVRLCVVGPDRQQLFHDKKPVSGMEYVRRVVHDDAVRARIDLVGPLPYEDVRKLYARGSITVVPSRFESFGNVLIEAMVTGSPVVAANAGAMPEIVQHERNGLLFVSGDAQDLASQMARLLVDSDLRARLTGRARDDVWRQYNPELVATKTASFYREVMARSNMAGATL